MSLDDLVLRLQRWLDRLVRRLYRGRAPEATRRRVLIVQIDGLSRSVLTQALTDGTAPFLARLVRQRGWRLTPMSVGLPTSTPAFQMSVMYGVRPDIPGFHYHDKRRRSDVYFPRGHDALLVEAAQAQGRRGILEAGSAYGCVFTGGATSNLLTFAMIRRPSRAGLLCMVSQLVVLGWVLVKCCTLSAIQVIRALFRFVADPVGESARGWRWLAIKIGISVWLRELFTLAVARDLYAGVPAIYVNYLDYDVFAHAYGPRHRRALRALRRIDRSISRLWRVLRRVPEHRYDLYVLSDHGQVACTPYERFSGGKPIEQALFDDLLDPLAVHAEGRLAGRARRVAHGIAAYRTHHASGFFQRFVNYLERDFPWVLGGTRGVREHGGIRVVSAGPNAFVYFREVAAPVEIAWIEERFPGLAEELSRSPGIGFVLARAGDGPVCAWRGKRYLLHELGAGPFAGRVDLPRVLEGLRDLMAMESAGDLVVYGIDAPEGDVSFGGEVGAHAGTSYDELHTFVIHPPTVTLPSAIAHPVELYAHFRHAREAA